MVLLASHSYNIYPNNFRYNNKKLPKRNIDTTSKIRNLTYECSLKSNSNKFSYGNLNIVIASEII